jgi:hypothetical protein
MIQEHCERVFQRLRGLVTQPSQEIHSIDPQFYYSYFEFLKSYIAVIFFLHPVFSLMHAIIYNNRGINWKNDFLIPLAINFLIVLVAYIIGHLVSAFGKSFGISREHNEYGIYMLSSTMPFMALGIFRIIPWINNYVIIFSCIYIFIIMHLVLRRIFLLSYVQEVIFLLFKTFFALLFIFIGLLIYNGINLFI